MSDADYQRWICDACGYIYDEAKGDPDSGLQAGTRYDDIPDDWYCPLCGLAKSDLRLLPAVSVAASISTKCFDSKRAKASNMGGSDYVVIIGAGAAGWAAAEAVRRRAADKPILLITACQGAVYPKPALSMALSQGKVADDLIDLDAVAMAERLGIAILTETRVLKVDTKRKRITTVKGGIGYGKLVLALGGYQRELPLQGDAQDQVMRINDLASYRKLRERLNLGVSHVTILGAGLIGCEFADDLSHTGLSVSLIDPAAQPLSGLLPQSLSKQLMTALQSKGVEWHLQNKLMRLDRYQGRFNAVLSDGRTLTTDVVISAAGLIANTALAEKMGLTTDAGISVNHDMQTSHPDIYAIGDCASLQGQIFAYIEPIRRQAEAIAASIIGEHEGFMPLPPLVRVKTPSLPLSLCCPPKKSEFEWTLISESGAGSHYEAHNGGDLIGFAMSGIDASQAGGIYRKFVA